MQYQCPPLDSPTTTCCWSTSVSSRTVPPSQPGSDVTGGADDAVLPVADAVVAGTVVAGVDDGATVMTDGADTTTDVGSPVSLVGSGDAPGEPHAPSPQAHATSIRLVRRRRR